MNCLSIQQPWSSAILMGVKQVENRTWLAPKSAIRKPLLIHAGKRAHEGLPQWVRHQLAYHDGLLLEELKGAILGVVELVKVERIQNCQLEWAEGPWCWILKRPRVFLEPVQWKGQLGVFDVPDDRVRAAVDRAIDPTEYLRRRNEKAGLIDDVKPRGS